MQLETTLMVNKICETSSTWGIHYEKKAPQKTKPFLSLRVLLSEQGKQKQKTGVSLLVN